MRNWITATGRDVVNTTVRVFVVVVVCSLYHNSIHGKLLFTAINNFLSLFVFTSKVVFFRSLFFFLSYSIFFYFFLWRFPMQLAHYVNLLFLLFITVIFGKKIASSLIKHARAEYKTYYFQCNLIARFSLSLIFFRSEFALFLFTCFFSLPLFTAVSFVYDGFDSHVICVSILSGIFQWRICVYSEHKSQHNRKHNRR